MFPQHEEVFIVDESDAEDCVFLLKDGLEEGSLVISGRFVVKTLAPPVHRNLVDSVAVQILYPGQCLTCQTSEAYDIPI